MNARLGRPLGAVAFAVATLAVALTLDHGSPANRDAALLIGSVALYGLIPLSLIWLLVAVVRHLRRQPSSGPKMKGIT